jgi:hypothetical protein
MANKTSKNWNVLRKSIYNKQFRLIESFDTLDEAKDFINYYVNYLYAKRTDYKIVPIN